MTSRRAIPDRPAQEICDIHRLGVGYATPLSFTHHFVRRAFQQRWEFSQQEFALAPDGTGMARYRAKIPVFAVDPRPDESQSGAQSGKSQPIVSWRIYDLVCFAHAICDEHRSDRVIAKVWDATFTMVDGDGAPHVDRLRQNTPRQEDGRYCHTDLVLARANKSLRVVDTTIDALAHGSQPEPALLNKTGYLLRTSAVYGNGKFGMASRARVADRPEFADSFAMEMLAVYMIRLFSFDYIDARARHRRDALGLAAPAAALGSTTKRFLGIGNATGLGMAPFIARHPVLVDQWLQTREAALGAVLDHAPDDSERARHAAEWRTTLQSGAEFVTHWEGPHSAALGRAVSLLGKVVFGESFPGAIASATPVTVVPETIWRAMRLSLCQIAASDTARHEVEQACLAMLLGVYADIAVGALQPRCAKEKDFLDPQWTLSELRTALVTHFAWALEAKQGIAAPSTEQGKVGVPHLDKTAAGDPTPQGDLVHTTPLVGNSASWYYSADKREPRVTPVDLPCNKTMPIKHQGCIVALHKWLTELVQLGHGASPVGEWLARTSGEQVYLLRQAVLVVQTIARAPLGGIHIDYGDVRPIDILRFKLSFFGATRFDPKSDQWVRVALFQGAPTLAYGHLESGRVPLFPLLANPDG
ncbi:MAG: hypothetical protein K0U36_00010 [Alphaproteobacteria bacterium]|nr:hypothetical protein [Alphaproteobacteria bacterium]